MDPRVRGDDDREFLRHCEPTGRREAPPDDRLSEAIQLAAQRKDGLLRSARNDDETQIRDLAAGFARVLPTTFRLPKIRGRRECRALDAPAAARVE
jgi:hypothetical protein